MAPETPKRKSTEMQAEADMQRRRMQFRAEALIADAMGVGIVIEIRTVPLPAPNIPRMGGYIMEAHARVSNSVYRAIDELVKAEQNGN